MLRTGTGSDPSNDPGDPTDITATTVVTAMSICVTTVLSTITNGFQTFSRMSKVCCSSSCRLPTLNMYVTRPQATNASIIVQKLQQPTNDRPEADPPGGQQRELRRQAKM